MATTFFENTSLVDKDRACIWHPFTQMQTAKPPIPIVRAKGVYLYDASGNCYLDAISSWWVNLHGHTHPYIAQKIKSQSEILEHVIFADFTHAPAIDLASRLISLLPGKMSKVFYSDNGSTSVEAALKIAIQFWHNQNVNKKKIICFKNSYHGDTFGAMSASGKNPFNRPFWTHLFEVTAIDPPLKGQEKTSLQQLESLLELEDTACFIFEPLVLGSGGMIIYPPNGLDLLIQSCKKHQVLTIADEVMTGFGRTGTLFACDQLQEEPDIICLSKGLTGGFLPLGATICTENIFNAFLGNHLHQAFLHGHSYTANPLACSSALASLDLLLEDKCTHQRKLIENSHHSFCQKWKFHPKLKRCEVQGTILVLEYHTNTPSYFDSLRDQLYGFFLEKKILLRPLGNVLYLLPPYCIQEEELQFIYDQIILTLEGGL
ncbi:adenosylmethionine--8-amino-7-oxononanoate transaminase [Criblamydia sequanensis]|uniref:Adenosylmethionine-8-amino-7-oxononanoate aminotransferase n=1 Tax=Candidatus Criblamydia sequanensis CRIB-18 TaxID=1437425 RepID=A0A090E2I5_9BACT|nr:adenosylmethionine--8-amino-7-oxononanoate transaminase [Criblamydia sequanensis]CDR34859.1 Adenosylmethionine-8-amino-7-oxononanoateaminotransferase [Criblamydia sequanensis CRIB-18]